MSKNCLQLIMILYCLTTAYFAFAASREIVRENENSLYNVSLNGTNNNTDKASPDTIYTINQHAHIAENLIDGDMKFSMFRNAIGRKWPKSKDGLVYIPYKFFTSYSIYEENIMKKAMEGFQKHTCIRFIPRKSQKDYIYIMELLGCWSYVGKASSIQLVSLSSPDCVTNGIVQHELMHVLGFEHEHSRSDRDFYIRIPTENIDTMNSNLKKNFWTNNLVIYDYGSVMHYESTVFAKRDYLRSMEIYPPQNPEPTIGKREKMSAYDIEEIKYYYGCGPKTYSRCGRDFKNRVRGSFKSPSYPKNYPPDAHCTWSITARPGRYIKLTITNIDISNSTLCENDALIIHDGIDAGASVKKRICGKKSKIVIISRSRRLFVIFTSDNEFGAKGFQASFVEVTERGKLPPAIFKLPPPVPARKNLIKSFQCNFDVNVCGMKQDKTDKENYILHRGKTKNSHTGPSKDSTSRRGKYLYFNGKTKSTNNAIIRTPWFKPHNRFCIEFKYHMYGSSMGALRVYAFEKKKSSKQGKRQFLWEKLDDQKNKWHTARINYTPNSEVQQVQFYWESIANGPRSDIGIDDVVVSEKVC